MKLSTGSNITTQVQVVSRTAMSVVLFHPIAAANATISTPFHRSTTSIQFKTPPPRRKNPNPTSFSQPSTLTIRAALDSDGPRRRLVDIIRTLPDISRNYFRSPSRRALFGGISLLGGFYVAQTISLSFGALGVNDVIAAVLCVLVTEYVTKFYYTRSKVTFPLALLNNFKMGFTYGLFIDAFKLAS